MARRKNEGRGLILMARDPRSRSLHLTLGPQNRLYMRYAFETAAVPSRTRIHETIITTCGSPALVQPPLRSADLAPSTPFPVSPSLRYFQLSLTATAELISTHFTRRTNGPISLFQDAIAGSSFDRPPSLSSGREGSSRSVGSSVHALFSRYVVVVVGGGGG